MGAVSDGFCSHIAGMSLMRNAGSGLAQAHNAKALPQRTKYGSLRARIAYSFANATTGSSSAALRAGA